MNGQTRALLLDQSYALHEMTAGRNDPESGLPPRV
jgi:hypothetical protein